MRTTSAGLRPRLAALVLAAGGSSRLGQPKQLLRLRNEPMLLRACRMASAVADGGVIVVLGAGALRLRSLLRRHRCPVTIVHNAVWTEGMAGSLRAGLAVVSRRSDGLMINLVDQPGIESADLMRLAGLWRRSPGRPAAAYYQGRAGVPAIIPRRMFGALRAIEGDKGARHVLGREANLRLVEMPAAAIDIDTPGEAARLGRTVNDNKPTEGLD
jgi:molybdenum cofactor cytidylyltransferase